MNDSRLIVRLPSADRTFVHGYAAQYGISVSDVIRQCLAKLKESLAVAECEDDDDMPDVLRNAIGSLHCDKTDGELRDEYRKHLVEKYA